MKFLTEKERLELPLDIFGDPEKRLLPITSQEDVDLAPKRISVLPNQEEVKNRILQIISTKGFKAPAEWEAAYSEFSEISSTNGPISEFSLDSEAVKETSDGEYVLRTGKIFESGSYPDKKFEMTSEELLDAIADFQPVDVDLEHIPTILDGKLGKLEAVTIGANGRDLIGTVRLPKWLDKQLGDAERKVSATWDRATKKLLKLALVRNPRIKDAALMAAFMANSMADSISDATQEEAAEAIQKVLEEKFSGTVHGKYLMQDIHDMCSRSGAICMESEEEFNSAKSAGFVSEEEASYIQRIHDTALRGGAQCKFINEGSETSSHYKENEMNLNDVTNFLSNMQTNNGEVELSEETKAALEEKFMAELKAKQELKDTLRAEIEAEVREELKKEFASKTAETEEVSTPAVENNDESNVDSVDETETVVNSGPSERELELEKQLAELRKESIVRDAEAFANEEIRAERAFPSEKAALVALYTQSAMDDLESSVEISFGVGKEEVKGGRVEILKSMFASRKPHQLSTEFLEDTPLNILATYSDDEVDYLKEAEAQAVEYAKKRKAQIATEK